MTSTKRVHHDCALTPAAYWALRDDIRYCQYVASAGDPPTTSLELSCTEADGVVTRISAITAVKNPIPYALRGMLGCKQGFTFKITETWQRGAWDADRSMTFSTEPPVMADRISVYGAQWVEALPGGGSRLWFDLTVDCAVKGVGAAVARGIADGSLNAYSQLPARALEYATLRRAATEATEAGDAAGEALSRGATIDGDGGTEAVDDEAAAAGRRTRARLRWRMALMGVRFTRQLELEQSEELRLCDGRVDDARNEGFGPKRHTTYRVATRVRRSSVGWLECRKRYSDFGARSPIRSPTISHDLP